MHVKTGFGKYELYDKRWRFKTGFVKYLKYDDVFLE